MTVQYFKLQNGQTWSLDSSSGVASQVGSVPAGTPVETWTAAGAPPQLQSAPGYGSNPLPAASATPQASSGTIARTNTTTTPAQTTQPAATIASTPTQITYGTDSSQNAQLTASAYPPPTTALQTGDTGPAVQQLQNWLVANGYMTQAQVNTGYGTYGPQTTAAVLAVQQKYGVSNSSGPGDWGPQTMSTVNSVLQSQGAGALNSQTPYTAQSGTTNGTNTSGTTVGNTTLTTTNSSGQTTNGLQSGSTTDSGTTNSGGLVGVANNLLTSGYTIPSTLQITPALVSQFLSYAHQSVDPQTQQLISNEAANINASLANMTTQFQNQEGQTVQDFGTQLASQDNTAGANGTAFSGQRNLSDLNLAATTNRSLASNESTTGYNIGDLLRTGAADVGSSNTGQFSVPSLTGTTVGLSGGARGGSSTGSGINFNYNPNAYTVGNIGTQQNSAVNNLAANYQNQYSTLAANNSNGSKSINDLLGMMTGLPSGYAPFTGGSSSSSSNLM